MRGRTSLLVAALAVSTLAACSNADDDSSSDGTSADPGTSSGAGGGWTGAPTEFARSVVTRFDRPWAMTFLPGTPYLAVTEKGGTLKLRNQSTGKVTKVSGVPPVNDEGQGGFADIIPGAGYNGRSNRTVYLSWAQKGPNGTAGGVVAKAQLQATGKTPRLQNLRIIWRTPKTAGEQYALRMAISPDRRYLYVTAGERQQFTPAQDLNTNLGKVLRLTLDGKPAPKNPFAGRPGMSKQIWSYGHRNPLGIAFDAKGRLWSSEMGPRGGDELNLIQRAGNYGWPKASNGTHYDGRDIPDHRPGDGFVAPKVWWNPSISPSSLMIYSGKMFPQWKGDAFVGALSGEALIRVHLSGTSATKAQQWSMDKRIRDVVQGPDGALWLLEDGFSGGLVRLAKK